MNKTILLFACAFTLALVSVKAQNPASAKGVFKTSEPGYFQNTILKGIENFEKRVEVPKVPGVFRADPAGFDIPVSKDGFKTYWHNDPVSQGNTNTCWSYSTISFFESEVFRITGQKVKLSEMYPVYWEYVERASTWVKKRGDMYVGEGSEGNAVTTIMQKYGALPYADYSGLLPGQTVQSHEKMFGEIKAYLDFVKTNSIWNETEVIATVKDIMHHYMGEPPTRVNVNGTSYTPAEYRDKVLKIHTNDYADVLSYMQQPYWKQVEYEVPDNWWHSNEYYNLPLTDFMDLLKKSIKAGYTLAIGGDVSEAGFLRDVNAAIIPAFDIPSSAIDENARQFRFSNQTTTDDHGMHIVGYMEKDGVTWFLVKDSGSGSRTGSKENNKNFGYYFFHEDYVKLKIMDFMVHKDMMKSLLPKFS